MHSNDKHTNRFCIYLDGKQQQIIISVDYKAIKLF